MTCRPRPWDGQRVAPVVPPAGTVDRGDGAERRVGGHWSRLRGQSVSPPPTRREAVQQPVGVFEQMLKVVPKPGRDPLGDAGFDPAFRGDQRVGAEPLDRRRAGRMVRGRRQASTNQRTRSSFDCARCTSSRSRSPNSRAAPTREGSESVHPVQFRKMLVPGLRPHRRCSAGLRRSGCSGAAGPPRVTGG